MFRYRRSWLADLHDEFGKHADFFAIYTIEAHPVGGACPYTGEEWDTAVNWLAGVRLGVAESQAERTNNARLAKSAMGLNFPVLVDSFDDATWRAYGRAPAPAFVVNRSGRIAARFVWIDPAAMRTALRQLLAPQ